MQNPPQILLIADDLTGAADAAASIADRGLVTLLSLSGVEKFPVDALVYTTDSREMAREEAAQSVQTLVSDLLREGHLSRARLIYKKIDSTLRGHPLAELTALMQTAALDRALVAPAFPAQSRTTVSRRQLVGGAPLEETPFRGEIESSDLAVVFGKYPKPATYLGLDEIRGPNEALFLRLSRADSGLFVADAETDGDLAALAQASLAAGLRLFCGSAGLMSALIGTPGWSSHASKPKAAPHAVGPCLIVAGSRHPRTRDQVLRLQSEGIAALRVPATSPIGEARVAEICADVSSRLRQGRDVVLALQEDDRGPTTQAGARRLAEMCCRIIADAPPSSLILTGGDTARAVALAFEVSAILILGEIVTGLPHGVLRGGRLSGVPVATKAGGFGAPDALLSALDHLKSGRTG